MIPSKLVLTAFASTGCGCGIVGAGVGGATATASRTNGIANESADGEPDDVLLGGDLPIGHRLERSHGDPGLIAALERHLEPLTPHPVLELIRGSFGDQLAVVEHFNVVGAREKIGYLLNKLRYAPEKIKHKLYRRAYKIYRKIGRPLPPALKNIEEINFAAVKDYVPQTFAGDVTLFLATDLTADYDLHEGWHELVEGRIEAHEIPGNHINIIKEPHVRVLAEKLRGCLERAQEKHSRTRRAA